MERETGCWERAAVERGRKDVLRAGTMADSGKGCSAKKLARKLTFELLGKYTIDYQCPKEDPAYCVGKLKAGLYSCH